MGEYIEIEVENIIGGKRVIKGHITEVESDCIHIKTLYGEDECISIN